MGLSATLRRHRLCAVLAALAMWLTQPALAAFCPCLSPVSTAQSAHELKVVSACCDHCCTPEPEAEGSSLTAPGTTPCPVFDAVFSSQQGVLADLSSSWLVGAMHLARPDPGDSLDLQRAVLLSPQLCAPIFDPPRKLASLVAGRCHPCNAPPLL